MEIQSPMPRRTSAARFVRGRNLESQAACCVILSGWRPRFSKTGSIATNEEMQLKGSTSLTLLMSVAACGTDTPLSLDSPPPTTTKTNRRGLEAHCFYGETHLGPVPLSRIVHAFTATEIDEHLDVAISFNRDFVDLSYGAHAVGWETSKKGRHSFKDLVGSDHTELALFDSSGNLAFQAKLDLLTDSSVATSGYASLGVTGGDGKLITGSEGDVLGFGSSLHDNFNERGYVLLEDSPATTPAYAENPEFPGWNFFVEYRVSVALSAFGAAGFGRAHMEMVHASPSKLGQNTVIVTEGDCPDPGGEGDPFVPCEDASCLDGPGESPEPGGEPDPGGEKDPPSNDPGSCSADLDCASGERCREGACIPEF